MTQVPMFPFGFGLTYSKTEIGKISVEDVTLNKKQSLNVSVEVSNVGNFDIDEVVQLYVNPINPTDGIPLKSLKAFQRISLKLGEKKTLNFQINPDDLMVINTEGKKVWRKGKYNVVIGNASPGDLSKKLGAVFAEEITITLK